MILSDKRNIKYLIFCFAYFMVTALFLYFHTLTEAEWFSRWFFDTFYTFNICIIYLAGSSVINRYFNTFTLIRIGTRKKYIIYQLLQHYCFAFLLLSMMFICLFWTSIIKFSTMEANIITILQWYLRYLLGLIMITNLTMVFNKSNYRILAEHSYLFVFAMLSFELLSVIPKIKMLYSINISVFFSWIFYDNLAISYISMITINLLLITYLICVSSRKDIFYE